MIENDDEIIKTITNKQENTNYNDIMNSKLESKKNNQNNIEKPCNFRDSNNWLAYNFFLRQNYSKTKDILEKNKVKDTEFSMTVTSLIMRSNGEIEKSVDLLKKCFSYNSNNTYTLKEIGKSLVLNGKNSLAIDIYDEVLEKFPNDWEIYHYKGLASMNDKAYETAQICFEKALSINNNETT